jgi:hypothetical protein
MTNKYLEKIAGLGDLGKSLLGGAANTAKALKPAMKSYAGATANTAKAMAGIKSVQIGAAMGTGVGLGMAMNKFQEKKAGLVSRLGTFAKNLTGETVREAKSVSKLHETIGDVYKAKDMGLNKYTNQFKDSLRNGSSAEKKEAIEHVTRAHDTHMKELHGMGEISNQVNHHFRKTPSVSEAIRDRNEARTITGGALALGGLGAAIAKKKKEQK